MGCDVYLEWEGITEEEKQKQITGFDVTCGRFGYLRGAYNGHIGFDAIKILLEKYFKKYSSEYQPIDVPYIESQLQKLEKGLFKEKKKEFHPLEQKSYRDFVALARKKVLEGLKVRVRISG